MAVRLSPRDAMYQANLGDLYQKLERREEARLRYLRAQSLTEEQVKDDPDNTNADRRPCLVFGEGPGLQDGALALTDELPRTLPDTGPNTHQLAYIFAICGDDDAAIGAIRRAIELGDSAELIRHEDEFRTLHARPEFITLVGGLD